LYQPHTPDSKAEKLAAYCASAQDVIKEARSANAAALELSLHHFETLASAIASLIVKLNQKSL